MDAQDKLPSSKPYHCNSDNESELDQQPDNSYIPDIHNISLPASDSGSETCLKSVLEPGIMESPSSTPTQLSQSLLDGAGMGGPAYGPPPELGTSGAPQMTQIPQMPQFQQGNNPLGATMLNTSYPVPQYQPMPNIQVDLSDTDIMRIAIQTKQLLSDEIDKLVQQKVLKETADLRDRVTNLETDNKKLQESVVMLESKLSTKIDDLEQYSRRSCLRIAGVPETEHENTDDKVLDLATRLNIDISPRDIEAIALAQSDPMQPRSLMKTSPNHNQEK